MAAGDGRRGGDEAEQEGSSLDGDWQHFRTKLVLGEEDGKWAYNAGNLVEQGCLLLGGTELEYGYGLRQQHFHKCVLLILSHTDEFTRGVILNRPTRHRTAAGTRLSAFPACSCDSSLVLELCILVV
jgi:hypothetical protein